MSKIDPALIVALQKGKRRARSSLYKQMAVPMLSVCLRYTRNRMEAEDVLHDAFVKVYEKVHQYKGNGPFEGWVRRVVVNTAIQYLRDKTKLNAHNESDSGVEFVAEQDMMDYPLQPEELLRLMQEMPEGYRLVFNMYVMEDYSHREIAETLGISEGTSKSQLHNAKQFLRKLAYELIEKNN